VTEETRKAYGPNTTLAPKGVVGYAGAATLDSRCGICVFYDAEYRRCGQVAGEIDSDATCVLFSVRRPSIAMPGGMPGSVSTLAPLDVPSLYPRMDLYRAADVRAGFVRKDADGFLSLDVEGDEDAEWLQAMYDLVRSLTGYDKSMWGGGTGDPVLDLLVEGDACRLVAHSPLRATIGVAKADDEKRYTLGPLYMPDTLDAHGDFVTPETLQNAAWGYVRAAVSNGSNTIYDQHTDSPAGEWVDLVTWPFEQTVKMTVPGEGEVERTFPAGTVYQGVVWSPSVWEEVKSGAKRGLSMGGMAVPATVEFARSE